MTNPTRAALPDEAGDDGDYYNPIFEKITDGEHPVVAAAAYSLYKRAKREWVQDFRKAHGRRPNDDECRGYAATQTDQTLQAYQSQAKQILAEYAESAIQQASPKILKEALKGSFRRSFWPSFFASAAFAGLLLLIVLVAAAFGFGLPIQFVEPTQVADQISN